MQLRHVNIQRFRGIQSLDWQVDGQLICLVGPGDSTKSTILSAVDYALSPRWKLDFDDSDFYNGDASSPFSITVTIGGLPTEFKSDAKFGLDLRGWGVNGLNDEPQEEDELVISIQLTVDKSLEPKWLVVNDRRPEGRPISATDRDSLGMVRIGDFLDRHLTWEEVQETVARLRFWRQGLCSPELTGEDPSTLKELGAFVEQFGKGVRKFWEQAVKTRRIRKSDLLQNLTLRHVAEEAVPTKT